MDTSIFIYHLGAHPDYLPLTTTILNNVQVGQQRAVTSVITIMESTMYPWRLNRPDIARQYEALLANFPNLHLAEVNRDIVRRAAQLRTSYNLRPTDALQLATALDHQATAWVSNDKKLRRLAAILEIILLDEFIAP